jgi:hypothetical protein
MGTTSRIINAVVLVIILALVWFFRPLFHGYVMSIWIDPLGTLLLTGAVVMAVVSGLNYLKMAVRAKRGKEPDANAPAVSVPATLAVLLLVSSLVYKFAANDLRLAQAYKTYDFQATTVLPSDDQPRLVPLAVAKRFGADSLQRPTEKAYTWHSQLWDGEFGWVAPLTPNGVVRQWLDQAAGFQVVDASTAERQTSVVSQKSKYSEGVQLTDNIRWQLYKKQFLVDLPEVFYGKVDNKIYAIVPMLRYEGLLIRHPVMAGAFVVSPDGTIEQLTVDQARQHEAVKAAGRLYPESYVRFMHESYALKGGVFNKWFRHVDQTEISNPAGEDNRQPYMLSTKDGLKWLSAADPWGKSFGVYKIFLTDAVTGQNQLYSVPVDAALTGASQAIGYVKSARPQYNWRVEGGEDEGSSGNILAIEPRPVFVQNQLYWMISVTTNESKGINETCFVNAKDNRVTCAANDEEIKSFVTTGAVKPAEPKPASDAPATSAQQRVEKLEATLRQALRELEELKTAQ